jgi:hypothetical protein
MENGDQGSPHVDLGPTIKDHNSYITMYLKIHAI